VRQKEIRVTYCLVRKKSHPNAIFIRSLFEGDGGLELGPYYNIPMASEVMDRMETAWERYLKAGEASDE